MVLNPWMTLQRIAGLVLVLWSTGTCIVVVSPFPSGSPVTVRVGVLHILPNMCSQVTCCLRLLGIGLKIFHFPTSCCWYRNFQLICT